MKESVFSALPLLVAAVFLTACVNVNPGLEGGVSGVTSIGDGKIAVSRNVGGLLPLLGREAPPFVIDCSREKSPYC